MGTSKVLVVFLVLAGAAHSREAVSPAACQAAGQTPTLMSAKAAVVKTPADLQANFSLADAWSDAGCFNEAVQVLQAADTANPGDPQLQTRLRVARSLVGEEHFFDNIDRADASARLKRDTFRCSSLGDVDACAEADRLSPNDPAIMTSHGDALLRVDRPGEALVLYRHAAAMSLNQHDLPEKIASIEAQMQSRNAQSAAARDATAQIQAAPTRPVGAAAKVRVANANANANANQNTYANAGAGTHAANAAASNSSLHRYSNEELDESQSH
jgi:hypothetical protein